MKIYIIRHGQTDWNVTRQLQGATDIPLNEKGVALARMTAEGLADISFDCVFTSPLMRAKETARIIMGERRIPLIEEERIKEISFGIYEGLSCSKEHDTVPDPEFMNFFLHPELYVPPKGGETIDSLCERTTDFLRELIQNPDNQDKTILISTHGAAAKGLLSSLIITDKKDFWNGGVHKNCGVSLITVKDGVPALEWEDRVFYQEMESTSYF